MKSSYDAIYLSPHLDDAILSCGGQIHQLTRSGGSVLVVSIMAGEAPSTGLSKFALSLHERWELAQNASAERREEDKAASQVVGADCHHLELQDCIYRRHPISGAALYDSEEALFGQLHPTEEALAEALVAVLARLPAAERVFAPLTAGHHVDHQLTRLAAERWLGSGDLNYYEEYPYALAAGAMPPGIDDRRRWRPSIVRLTTEDVAARIDAIACYRSQLSTFFRDRKDLANNVDQVVREVGGERVWRRIAP